ncbi:MAG: hypothetical protein R3Y47_13190, partial [Lachnospiraceae bacterium]
KTEEEIKKIEERRKRFRRNYEKRKANGKQAEYYQKTKDKKRAELLEKMERLPIAGIPLAEFKASIQDEKLESRYDYV